MNDKDSNFEYEYLRWCVDSDRRIRTDLKNHNWLLMKIATRNELENMRARQTILRPGPENMKSPPKRRASLPISLPISLYQKYINVANSQKEKDFMKQSTNKLSHSIVDKISLAKIKISSKIIKSTQENKKETVNPLAKNINDKKSNEISSKGEINPMEFKLSHLNSVHETKNKDILTRKINAVETCDIATQIDISTQTNSAIIDRSDLELLNALKKYGYTTDDIESFYQNSIKNNNNTSDCQNLNEMDVDESEYETNEDEINEKLTEEDTNKRSEVKVNDGQCDTRKANGFTSDDKKNKNDLPSVMSGTILDRLRACSDLNKLILSTFYEGINLHQNKDYDKIRRNKELSQLSHSLVDKIYQMFIEYIDSKTKNFSKDPEIIDLVNDCEVLPKKRKMVSDFSEKEKNLRIKNLYVISKQQEVQTMKKVVPQNMALNQNAELQWKRNPMFPNTHPERSAFSYNQKDPRLSRYFNATRQDLHMDNVGYDSLNYQRESQNRVIYGQYGQQHQNPHPPTYYGQGRQQNFYYNGQIGQNSQVLQNACMHSSNRPFEQMMQQQDLQYTSNVRNSYPYNFPKRQ